MAIDGTLKYAVSADTRGFSGPLQAATQQIAGLGGSIASLMGPISAVIGVAGGLAGISKAMGQAADLESMAVAFKVLAGSMETGKKLMDDIKQMGTATPYSFPALAEGGKTLLNFGVSAKSVLPTLKMLGDIAGGDSAKMSSLALAFGQISSLGRLTGVDLMQLINAGFNPLQEISDRTGESMASLQKRMEQGAISASEVRASFAAATSEGGKFYGMMEAQSKTTHGTLATLRDNIDAMFATIGEPLNEAMKPLMKGATEFFNRFGTGLAGLIKIGESAVAEGKIGELISMTIKLGAMEGANYLVGALEWSATQFGGLLEFGMRQATRVFSGESNETLKAFGTGLGMMMQGIGHVIRAAIGGPFNEIVAVFQAGLQHAIETVMSWVGKIPKIGEKLGLDGFEATDFNSLLVDALGENDPEKLKAQGKAMIVDALEAMGGSLREGGEAMAQDWKDSFEGLDGFEAADFFETDGLKSELASLAQALNPEGFEELMAALTGAAAPVKDALDDMADDIAEAVSEVTAPLHEEAEKAQESGKKKIRLYGLEESEQRRYDRMSAVDKAKYASGTRVGASRASSMSLLGQIATAPSGGMSISDVASSAAPAMAPQAARRGGAGGSRESSESQLLAVLLEISLNTEPLKKLAVA